MRRGLRISMLAAATALGTVTAAASTAAAGQVGGASRIGGKHGLVRYEGGLVRLRSPGTSFRTTQSNNWSGYNQGVLSHNDKPFTAIAGSWTVPKAAQHKRGEAESSATWIGIGGGCLNTSCTETDSTLIQTGTEQDVAKNGKASYSSWYELIPAPSTSTSLAVRPGDRITATISQSAPGLWSITLKNVTTGKHWSTSVPYSSSMATAEWIEETPLLIGGGGTGISALPKLGTVHFSGATVNGANAGLKPAQRMQLVDSKGHVLATPSAPNSRLNAFNDCTYATTCAAPTGR